jgi:hypothetical protein
VHQVQFWALRRWRLSGKGRGRRLLTCASVYREQRADGSERWSVLVSDQKGQHGRRRWEHYHGRGGAIEEYNDQAERAYHLEVVRTGNFAGLNALHSLMGLCWNLTQWVREGLRLPPLQAPTAAPEAWVAAAGLDVTEVQRRAAHSGLRLERENSQAVLEIEDTVGSAESSAWRQWLQQPIQLRLRWTG